MGVHQTGHWKTEICGFTPQTHRAAEQRYPTCDRLRCPTIVGAKYERHDIEQVRRPPNRHRQALGARLRSCGAQLRVAALDDLFEETAGLTLFDE